MPMMFQLTAARRRLVVHRRHFGGIQAVSTHSRPKAAGPKQEKFCYGYMVSTHSRPKAAGQPDNQPSEKPDVSTHSRPKAAGRRWHGARHVKSVST